mmetsp:Transcript_21163/g.49688  ORF Transcript_21163/g.49688 Transcript_21163/m.49688 type:complete len:149 (+) Transcript_21163:55-501(+)
MTIEMATAAVAKSPSGDQDTFSFEPVEMPVPVVKATAPHLDPDGEGSNDEESDEIQRDPSDAAVMIGCGLVGCMFAGPAFAILTALGGKWASKQDNAFAELSKSIGSVAELAGKKAQEEDLLTKLKSSVRLAFNRGVEPNSYREGAAT